MSAGHPDQKVYVYAVFSSLKDCWKSFPESRNDLNSRISGTGKGKPAANLGSTLPGTLSQPPGVFFESTVPAFSNFSDIGVGQGD